jgi:(p)ppGpp synthase/HD superfamily hydrolase
MTVPVAVVLLDTMEDTQTTPGELGTACCPEIRPLVPELTSDKSQPKVVRERLQVEHGPDLSPEAKLITVAERIANIRDVTDKMPGWSVERRRRYLECAETAVAGWRGVTSAFEERFDETFRQVPEVYGEICIIYGHLRAPWKNSLGAIIVSTICFHRKEGTTWRGK